MKPALKPAPKTKKPFPTKKVLCAILLLALVFTGFAAYHAHNNKLESEKAFQADKARFAEVERDMQKVYSNIVLSTGKPIEGMLNEKGCGYTSQKFAKGELICNIQYTFAYAGGIESLKAKLKSLINSFSKGEENGITLDDNSLPSSQSAEVAARESKLYLNNNHGVSCYVTYSIKDLQSLAGYGISSSNNGDALIFQFRCSDRVRSPVYTLAE